MVADPGEVKPDPDGSDLQEIPQSGSNSEKKPGSGTILFTGQTLLEHLHGQTVYQY